MTNETATPERVEQIQAQPATKETSMFDMPEWMDAPGDGSKAVATFAGVRFQPVGKVYHYMTDGLELKVGDWVVVDTVRGRQMGQVATLKPPRDIANLGAVKHIERRATGRDMALRHYYEGKELEAMITCRAESNALGLPIKIVKAEYSFDGQTLTFLYASDQEERVETNELRQVMSRLYRARIETRQVSPREVAKIVGGMGACGIEQRCCSRFLTEFSPISIKHAKEQGLSLNPHDITGMCGRLRCCLIYEYEQYVEARRHLPKKNAIVGTPSGQGKVVDIMPMRDSVLVRIGEEEPPKLVVVHREQIVPLEELKRLQEKAASGTCDKHESGQCDCGKDKAAATGAKAPAQAVAGDVTAVPADAATAEGAGAPAPGGGTPAAQGSSSKARKKNKKATHTGTHPGQKAPGNTSPAQAPAKPTPVNPAHKRHAHTKHTHPGERSPSQRPPDAEPSGPEPDSGADQSKQRRPLRRPLQRRPPTS